MAARTIRSRTAEPILGEAGAAGLVGLRAKQGAESGNRRESSLDFSARQSVHDRKDRRGERR